MDEVKKTRRPLVVTKNGKPVVKLVPAEKIVRRSVLGCMRGTAKIVGDLMKPVVKPEEWEALRDS